ncbi:MAG: S1 RNA-binding domain-containing protein, partial [Waterburya sp.]
RHRRVNIERILDCNKEKISLRLEQIVKTGKIKIGCLVEGSVRGIKPYEVYIHIGERPGLLSKSNVSNNSISNLRDLFEVNDEIKSIIIDIIPEREQVFLSTKVLELSPGDIVKNRSSIMNKAEEIASRYYSENENLLTRKNEIVRSKLLIIYVIYKLYQIIKKCRQQENSYLEDMSDRELLIELCEQWADRFPQITSKEECGEKIVNQEFSEIAEYLSHESEKLFTTEAIKSICQTRRYD